MTKSAKIISNEEAVKQISLKDYEVKNSAQDINDILKEWVNREEKAWYPVEPAPLLPMKVKKNTHVRWDLFFLGVLKENARVLLP